MLLRSWRLYGAAWGVCFDGHELCSGVYYVTTACLWLVWDNLPRDSLQKTYL